MINAHQNSSDILHDGMLLHVFESHEVTSRMCRSALNACDFHNNMFAIHIYKPREEMGTTEILLFLYNVTCDAQNYTVEHAMLKHAEAVANQQGSFIVQNAVQYVNTYDYNFALQLLETQDKVNGINDTYNLVPIVNLLPHYANVINNIYINIMYDCNLFCIQSTQNNDSLTVFRTNIMSNIVRQNSVKCAKEMRKMYKTGRVNTLQTTLATLAETQLPADIYMYQNLLCNNSIQNNSSLQSNNVQIPQQCITSVNLAAYLFATSLLPVVLFGTFITFIARSRSGIATKIQTKIINILQAAQGMKRVRYHGCSVVEVEL